MFHAHLMLTAYNTPTDFYRVGRRTAIRLPAKNVWCAVIRSGLIIAAFRLVTAFCETANASRVTKKERWAINMPQYITPYILWAYTVELGLRPNASVADMDRARHALARRADRVPAERAELQRRYDALLQKMTERGWR